MAERVGCAPICESRSAVLQAPRLVAAARGAARAEKRLAIIGRGLRLRGRALTGLQRLGASRAALAWRCGAVGPTETRPGPITVACRTFLEAPLTTVMVAPRRPLSLAVPRIEREMPGVSYTM